MAKRFEDVSEVDRRGAAGREPTGRVSEAGGVAATAYGRRLLDLHRRIVDGGDGLSTREELEREIAERRGGAWAADDR